MIGRNVPHTASAIATISARVRLARQVWANRARFTSARPRAGRPAAAGRPRRRPRRRRRTRGRPPRGAPARSSGRGSVSPAMAARNGPTSPSSRQRQPAVGDADRRMTPGTPSSAGGGALDAASRRCACGAPARSATSSSATSRPCRTIATRSHTRSTSDRTCDEKKIVRPAAAGRRGSRRRRAASAGRGPRSARRGSPAPGRAGAPG